MPSQSKPRALRALKALLRQPFDPNRNINEMFRADAVYGDASRDRAVALLAATNMELCLQLVIEKHMIPLNGDETQRLFGPEAPVGTLSAKIKMAYALGIISRRFVHDANCIREIRNTFAHAHVHVDFETPAITDAIRELKFPKFGHETFSLSRRPLDDKEVFCRTALWLCTYLYDASEELPFKVRDAKLYPAAHTP